MGSCVEFRRLSSRQPWPAGWALLLAIWLLAIWLLAAPAALAGEFSDEFDRQRFKDALQHEVAFREAAIHVAWSAEPLCDDTTEIEPFVLWSLRGVKTGLSAHQTRLFSQATGMDEHWRIVWMDESVPDEMRLGQRVLAINDRALPAPGARVEMGAVFRGGSPLSVDDQAFWQCCTALAKRPTPHRR